MGGFGWEDPLRACLAFVFIAAAPQMLRAEDIAPASRIDRVTVYRDAALVTRTAPVDLQEGASRVTLRGLPAGLDPASVQVSAQADGALTIGAVDVRLVPGEAKVSLDPALQERIDALKDERDGVAARIQALDAKRAAIELYAKAAPGGLGVEGKPFDVAQWQGAWDAIGSGLDRTLDALRQARKRQLDLDVNIAAAERAKPRPTQAGAPQHEISLALQAGAALRGEVVVAYRVTGATWQPAYEARLGTDTGKTTLDLLRRAQVSQKTGEEWSNVELSVSTLSLNRSGTAPELVPLQVSFFEPPSYDLPSPEARSKTRALAPAAPAARLAADEPARERAESEAAAAVQRPRPPPQEAEVQKAAIETAGYQVSYRVPGRIDLGQAGLSKTFVLASRRVQPALSVVATPELDQTAYFKASFPLDDEAPLLPGEVSLYRDRVFVGRTQLKLTVPGEAVDLGFGIDDRVKITRVPLRRRENEPTWFGQTKTDLREFKTTVRNLHTEPVRISVSDRIPFSENATITVEQLRETTTPTEKQPNDRRGILVWSHDYRPGEQREIRLSYRLKWPAERDVVFSPRP